MTKWIVFYDTGETYSSDDGGPEGAPKDGVIVIAVSSRDTGRTLWHSADYYCWHKTDEVYGEWVPHNQRGLDYYLSKEDQPGIYIAGYSLPVREWRTIFAQALSDPRMDLKSAWSPFEAESYAPAIEKAELEKEWAEAAAKAEPRKEG
jgi:hypothetical protein